MSLEIDSAIVAIEELLGRHKAGKLCLGRSIVLGLQDAHKELTVRKRLTEPKGGSSAADFLFKKAAELQTENDRLRAEIEAARTAREQGESGGG